MFCEYCNCEQDDLNLLTLPCGYLVCNEHIRYQDSFFECIICKNHLIDKKGYLEMKKNERKIDEINFIEKKESILNLCDQIDTIKKEIESYLKNHLSKVNNKIDLKRNFKG